MFMSGSARAVTVLAVAGGFLAMAALPATAAPATIKGPQNLTVSCDGITSKKGVPVHQDHTGGFKVRQNSTNPTSRSIVWAVDGSGHSLPSRNIGNGGTASWTDVLPGNYTIEVHRAGAANCNGIGLGHGNYNWNYTVTYDG